MACGLEPAHSRVSDTSRQILRWTRQIPSRHQGSRAREASDCVAHWPCTYECLSNHITLGVQRYRVCPCGPGVWEGRNGRDQDHTGSQEAEGKNQPQLLGQSSFASSLHQTEAAGLSGWKRLAKVEYNWVFSGGKPWRYRIMRLGGAIRVLFAVRLEEASIPVGDC